MALGKKIGKKASKSPTSIARRVFVGVDISSHSIKMVQISARSLNQISVQNCVSAPLPANTISDGKIQNAANIVATLQQLNTKLGGSNKTYIGCVPSSLVTMQNFTYDAKSGISLLDAAESEAVQVSVIEDVNFDYQLLGTQSEGGQDALLAIARKEDIEARVTIMDDAEMSPAYMDTENTARMNAYSHWINTQSPELENRVIAIFDIGAETTKAQIVHAGRPLYQQIVTVGSKHLTLDIQRVYQVSFEDAEAMKLGQNQPADFQNIVDSFNARITQEIQRVLQFFYSLTNIPGNQQIDKIFLTGGGSLCEGMAQSIVSGLNIDTKVLHPLEDAVISNKSDAAKIKQHAFEYTVALGLALRGLA